jgi:glucose dehydrogenase
MTRSMRFRLLFGAAAGLFVAQVPAQEAQSIDAAALRSARADGEWLTHGGDYGETRYSTLD